MKLFITINEYKRYLESITIPALRLVKNVEYKDYSNINIDNINLVVIDDDGHNIIHIGVSIDNELEEGIVIDVQIIQDIYYQLHTTIHENLKKQGLASKIYKKFISEFGNIYSSNGRRMNPIINKILDKFKNNSEYTYLENNKKDVLIVLNTNPDKDKLIEGFNI